MFTFLLFVVYPWFVAHLLGLFVIIDPTSPHSQFLGGV